jgi:pyruvate/2-oxoacid:ferredoxin oxidoreductase beta subunit
MMQKRFDIRMDAPDDALMQPGLLSCQGCGAALAMKLALQGLGPKTVVVIPACCAAVIVGGYPHCALNVSVVHVPFATAAAVSTGLRAGLNRRGETDTVVMAWAGDGGTFDIGLQALSGAAERNEDILYVCYDNEAYMNTGIQRSSATPPGAWTTTTPWGAVKAEPKKDIEKILLGHHIPYLATVSIAFPDDMIAKFQKMRTLRGTRFVHLLCPCPPGWGTDAAQTVRIARMATLSHLFPLYEVEKGAYRISVVPERPIGVADYFRAQGRFGEMSEEMTDAVQAATDRNWRALQAQSRS